MYLTEELHEAQVKKCFVFLTDCRYSRFCERSSEALFCRAVRDSKETGGDGTDSG